MNTDQGFGLIVLDCDGVLVDTPFIQHQVTAGEFTKFGYAITADELADRFCGVAMEEVMLHVENTLGRALPAGFEANGDRLAQELYATELAAIDGIRHVIPNLDLPICVASNSRAGRLRHVLSITGLYDLFSPNIFSVEAVVHPKPAPDLFLHAAASIGCLLFTLCRGGG